MQFTVVHRGSPFRQATNGRRMPKSREPRHAVFVDRGVTARRSPAPFIPRSSTGPPPPIFSSFTKLRVRNSRIFQKLIDECLVPKRRCRGAVEALARTTIFYAVLAGLLPRLLIPFGERVAEGMALGLLYPTSLFFVFTLNKAASFEEARWDEQSLMRQGEAEFGDAFAAAVHDYREGRL